MVYNEFNTFWNISYRASEFDFEGNESSQQSKESNHLVTSFEVLIEKLKIKLGDEPILKFFSSMVSCDSNYNKQASDLYNFA